MKRYFVIEIALGNSHMEDVEDIMEALLVVRSQLRENTGKVLRPVHSRNIKDVNGNTVGSWNIEERNE